MVKSIEDQEECAMPGCRRYVDEWNTSGRIKSDDEDFDSGWLCKNCYLVLCHSIEFLDIEDNYNFEEVNDNYDRNK